MHVNFNETLKWEWGGTNKCELLVGILTFFFLICSDLVLWQSQEIKSVSRNHRLLFTYNRTGHSKTFSPPTNKPCASQNCSNKIDRWSCHLSDSCQNIQLWDPNHKHNHRSSSNNFPSNYKEHPTNQSNNPHPSHNPGHTQQVTRDFPSRRG